MVYIYTMIRYACSTTDVYLCWWWSWRRKQRTVWQHKYMSNIERRCCGEYPAIYIICSRMLIYLQMCVSDCVLVYLYMYRMYECVLFLLAHVTAACCYIDAGKTFSTILTLYYRMYMLHMYELWFLSMVLTFHFGAHI